MTFYYIKQHFSSANLAVQRSWKDCFVISYIFSCVEVNILVPNSMWYFSKYMGILKKPKSDVKWSNLTLEKSLIFVFKNFSVFWKTPHWVWYQNVNFYTREDVWNQEKIILSPLYRKIWTWKLLFYIVKCEKLCFQ